MAAAGHAYGMARAAPGIIIIFITRGSIDPRGNNKNKAGKSSWNG